MRCDECGSNNADYLRYCGKCGADLPVGPPTPRPSATAAPRAPGSAIRKCPMCGVDLTLYDARCPRCYYQSVVYDEAPATRSNDPTLAGILMIVTGATAMIGALFLGAIIGNLAPSGFLVCCMAIYFLFGLASLVGGFLAVNRKAYSLTIIAAVLGLLTFAGFYGFVANLIAVFLLARSKDDFES